MATTTFVDRQTPIMASWLNDVNNFVYGGIVNAKMYGVVGDGVTDDTAAFAAAFAASDAVYVPAGTYLVSNITLTNNKKLLTAGFSTIFRQVPGQAVGTHIIDITGSNVTIEDIYLIGNISTDTNEQQHAIFIRGSSDITNITIGNVKGKDIRGDVLYVGGLTTATLRDVKVGSVYGDNILRNVVSVTGGSEIYVHAAISLGACGYSTFDVEPNASSQTCTNIECGYIKGRNIQVYGLNTNIIGDVRLGTIDMDPSFAANSNPPYASYTSIQYGAMQFANFRNLYVKQANINGYTYNAMRHITSTGNAVADTLVFDLLYMTNCSIADPTYDSYCNISAPYLRRMIVNGGSCLLYDKAVNIAFQGAPLELNNFYCDGALALDCVYPEFDSVIVEGDKDRYVSRGTVYPPTFKNCRITFTGGGLGRLTDADNATVIDCTITCNNFIVVSGKALNVVSSTLNGTYVSNGVWGYNTTYQSCMRLVGHYLWVDTTGDLRIKSSAPTTDLDGTVVGTQS